MRNMASENSHISRTIHELEDYDMDIRYIRESDNIAADSLLRMTHLDKHNEFEPTNPEYLPASLEMLWC